MKFFYTGSPLISVSILIPEYIEAVSKQVSPFMPPKQKKTSKKTSQDPEVKVHENSAYLVDETLSRKRREDYQLSKKLLYKSLNGVALPQSIRMMIRLDSDRLIFNERSNPQCVHWSTVSG